MATRAERSLAQSERSEDKKKAQRRGAKRASAARVHRARPAALEQRRARTAAEAKEESSGRYAGGVTARRNVRADRGAKQTYSLEDSRTGRPSRKSSRKGANRAKPDSQLRRREMRRARSPKARSQRGGSAG